MDNRNVLFIGVDPGKNECAVVLHTGLERDVGFFLKPHEDPRGTFSQLGGMLLQYTKVMITIEGQQYYRGQKGSVASDLLDLAYFTGWIASKLDNYFRGLSWVQHIQVDKVLPSTWKGQVPKDIHNRRITQKYGELSYLQKVPDGQKNHLIDAQGLCHYGRLELWT